MDLNLLAPHDLEIAFNLFLAGFLGAVIGLERERRQRPAGLRTLILICVGAAAFTQIARFSGGGPDAASRITANIITGIGFLGAGVVFRGSQRVAGLTTAASVWVVAAVGIAVGYGLYAVALVTVLISLLTLTYLVRVEEYMMRLDRESSKTT